MTHPAPHNLLILGASTRAAAFSALRAGLTPRCADLFADLDLLAHAEATRVEAHDYPDNLIHAAAAAPPGPWMFTGALENHPELVADITATGRPLWGNPPDVLRAVRDPFRVAECLERAGLPHPRCLPAERTPDADRRWLLKPRHGAGGSGIREAEPTISIGAPVRTEQRRVGYAHQISTSRGGHSPPYAKRDTRAPQPPENRDRFYWQEHIDGMPCSGLYVGDGGAARFLGATRQLVGDPRFGAKPFAYCGSLGPLPLEPSTRDYFEAVGTALAAAFSLRGLFGIDAILKDNAPWPVEINPRYTASVEVLEHALALPALDLHRAVFDPSFHPSPTPPPDPPAKTYVGKAILFAKTPLHTPDTRAWLKPTPCSHLPPVADVPHPGQQIEQGRPICTVFACGDSAENCYRLLLEHRRRYELQFTS